MLESSCATSSNCELKPPLQSLEEFLASVERRAYRTALLSTRKSADALDIVQDAMTQLVQYYRESIRVVSGHYYFSESCSIALWIGIAKKLETKSGFWQTSAPIDDDTEDEITEINEMVDVRAENPADVLARRVI